MEHGLRFIEEYPKFKLVLEKLYFKRELDDWYKDVCSSKFEIPKELKNISNVKDIEITDSNWPSVSVNLVFDNLTGEGGFKLSQELQVKVSKIIPVYYVDIGYDVCHNSLMSEISTIGPLQTIEIMEAYDYVSQIFKAEGYIELSYVYDLYDTVYGWHELTGIEPINRRLTLHDAVFVDVLDLCI